MPANNINKDIRLNIGFPNHVKTKMLKRRIGDAGVLSLITLWCYMGANEPDGDISNMTPEQIAIAGNWEGDAETFIRHLVEVGFIDETLNSDGSIHRTLHDWQEHNSYASAAKKRSYLGKKSAAKRWVKEGKYKLGELLHQKDPEIRQIAADLMNERRWNGEGKINERIGEKCQNGEGNGEGVNGVNTPSEYLPITYPNAPIPIPTPIPIIKEYCPERLNRSEPTISDVIPNDNQVSQKITISFEDKNFNGINEEVKTLLQEVYPLVNINREIRKMEVWILANPTRKKKNWFRFINNWLKKEQDKQEIKSFSKKSTGRFLDD